MIASSAAISILAVGVPSAPIQTITSAASVPVRSEMESDAALKASRDNFNKLESVEFISV
jgi:hypothetical protein